MKEDSLSITAAETDVLLTPREVSEITKLALPTLAGMRSRGEGPEYIKVTPGKAGRVRYWQNSVREWMNDRRT